MEFAPVQIADSPDHHLLKRLLDTSILRVVLGNRHSPETGERSFFEGESASHIISPQPRVYHTCLIFTRQYRYLGGILRRLLAVPLTSPDPYLQT